MNRSRREFLGTLLGAAAAGAVPSGLWAADSRRPRRLFADLHVHPTLDRWIQGSHSGLSSPLVSRMAQDLLNQTRVDWQRCHRAGVDLMTVAHYNPFDELFSMPVDPDPDAPRKTMRMLDLLEEILRTEAEPYARLARNAEEMRALVDAPKNDDYRIAVVHALEGGHHLGASPAAVAPLARRGVAMITLTHFFNKGTGAAGNPLPFFPDAGAGHAHRGLTGLGRELLAEMENHGVLVDVSHASARTVHDMLETARRPLVASHSSVSTLADHPYSLADEHIQEIVNGGGLIGVILMPYWLSNYVEEELALRHGSLRDAVRTIAYLVKLCGGHRHIAVGSDFAGYIPGPHDMKRLSQVGRLREMLLEEFNDSQLVDDVLAENTIRFLSENWGRTS